MTRRRHLLLTLPVALVLVAAGGWLLWPRPASAITRENAAKINVGMTLAEVEAVLGGPARDEATGAIAMDNLEVVEHHPGPEERESLWTTNQLIISVWFDGHGLVTSSHAIPVCVENESLLEVLRRWLGL
jgi:SmpA / OmlA family